MRTLIIIATCLILTSCITSNSKIKITDKDGNSITLSEDSVNVDIKQLERDGVKVEVIQEVE